MEDNKQQLEALQDIRKMMKDSSKFLSLSGLSGVFAGIYALIGAFIGHRLIEEYVINRGRMYDHSTYYNLMRNIILICLGVLLLSIVTAYFMSGRKAKKIGQHMFDHTSRKLLWNMLVPLGAGGLFCLSIIVNNSDIFLLSPGMLLFYGLALFNCSKYTMNEIRYLGYFEILLGLMACFFPGFGIIFWAMGFGVLHIIYGGIMWFKYDRNIQ